MENVLQDSCSFLEASPGNFMEPHPGGMVSTHSFLKAEHGLQIGLNEAGSWSSRQVPFQSSLAATLSCGSPQDQWTPNGFEDRALSRRGISGGRANVRLRSRNGRGQVTTGCQDAQRQQ